MIELVQQADHEIPFLYQGKQVLRIDVLDVAGFPHTNRSALCLQHGIGRTLKHLISTITDLSDKGFGFKSLQENLYQRALRMI